MPNRHLFFINSDYELQPMIKNIIERAVRYYCWNKDKHEELLCRIHEWLWRNHTFYDPAKSGVGSFVYSRAKLIIYTFLDEERSLNGFKLSRFDKKVLKAKDYIEQTSEKATPELIIENLRANNIEEVTEEKVMKSLCRLNFHFINLDGNSEDENDKNALLIPDLKVSNQITYERAEAINAIYKVLRQDLRGDVLIRALELKYLGGLNFDEIAEAINIPSGTLKSWFNRDIPKLLKANPLTKGYFEEVA